MHSIFSLKTLQLGFHFYKKFLFTCMLITLGFLFMKMPLSLIITLKFFFFGILLAFGMLFPNVRLMLLFPPIPIKAKWFVLFYGLYELYATIQNSPTDNVAHLAHLGGMLFAFILIKMWKK